MADSEDQALEEVKALNALFSNPFPSPLPSPLPPVSSPLPRPARTTKLIIPQRLKSALWFSIGKIVDEETLKLGVNATPQFIGALTELVWAQIGTCVLLSIVQHPSAPNFPCRTPFPRLQSRPSVDAYGEQYTDLDRDRNC